MKNPIKTKLAAFVALLLFTTCIASIANAQARSSMRRADSRIDKMDMKQIPYRIPQNPEDISPLLCGEKIPMAVLVDVSGKRFDLNRAISRKPTILVFYRGGWCPYCTRQLSGLQEAFPGLEEMGYQLIAISTDESEGLMKAVAKEKLSYTLLSDADLSLSKQMGIAYKAPKDYWEMLPKTTGGEDTDLLLPVPSVFILDQKGTIHFEFINPDFKQRLSSNLLLAAASSIKEDL
ncbi:peroxiredoxin-like family protein [uncultured Sphingobacterium sp.]|jgi:peroxiredoxin|uniref:peroxiredoxin-like family protein n=1 Tax=uncultured Sphingobacterium sp. TaxID=182688 RepID=UPI00374A928A